MRRFLIDVAVFGTILLLLAIVSDYAVSKGLRQTERGHFYTMNALMNDSINADVVVLGNSRAACSYHPIVLDSILGCNSVNLGVSGQPFGVSYLRWQLYERHNKRPRLLIVNIDYGELNMVTNGFEKEQYYPYITDTLVSPYLDLYGFSWMEKYIPMFRYRGDYKLMGIGIMELLHVRHDTKGGYIKGYSNKKWDWDGKKMESVLRNGRVECKCNPQAIVLLTRLLEKGKTDGIPIIFVYAPLYKALKENLNESNSNVVFRQLSADYDIPIVDLSQMDLSVDTCCFRDANHVNSMGAELFSARLAYCIDSLGLVSSW